MTDADDFVGQVPARKLAAALQGEQAGPAGPADGGPEDRHQGEGGGAAPTGQQPRTRRPPGRLLHVTGGGDMYWRPRDFQQGAFFHSRDWSR